MTNTLVVCDMRDGRSQSSFGSVERVRIDLIQADPVLHARARIDFNVATQYANYMEKGNELPPVCIVFDGESYWLADGFHRYRAAMMIGHKFLRCHVEEGTRRDAILVAIRENISQGLKRTNADKRKAVETLLLDSEWRKWSDREIARQCGVSNTFAGKVRDSLGQQEPMSRPIETRIASRGGSRYPMNIANIGQSDI